MISYIIQECNINSIPPKFCFIGDSIFAILLIFFLFTLIYQLWKC